MRPLSAADLDELVVALGESSDVESDAERIDLLAAMERVKGALSAAQARLTVDFKASQLAEQKASGVRRRDLGKGIAAQIGLARHVSPYRGSGLVGFAEALSDLPRTSAVLSRGEISEWKAMLLVREIVCLDDEQRRTVDRELAETLPGLSERQVEAEARRWAYRLDPVGFLDRTRKAESDRQVSLRPAPDTMTRLSALLPVAQGVAVYAALVRAADAGRATGDERGRGQLMADTLVQRVTGQATADQTPVEVQLVMTEDTLLDGNDEPAVLHGYGPMPAPHARHLLRSLDETTLAWVRRLVTDPVTGRLVALDTHRRLFRHSLRQAIVIRDQFCRTPWCGAPIRHLDHVGPSRQGGPTSAANGQGLCEACSYSKEAPGWAHVPHADEGAGASVTVTTPTGHSYLSRPPPLPGGRAAPPPGVVEIHHYHPPFTVEYAA